MGTLYESGLCVVQLTVTFIYPLDVVRYNNSGLRNLFYCLPSAVSCNPSLLQVCTNTAPPPVRLLFQSGLCFMCYQVFFFSINMTRCYSNPWLDSEVLTPLL